MTGKKVLAISFALLALIGSITAAVLWFFDDYYDENGYPEFPEGGDDCVDV